MQGLVAGIRALSSPMRMSHKARQVQGTGESSRNRVEGILAGVSMLGGMRSALQFYAIAFTTAKKIICQATVKPPRVRSRVEGQTSKPTAIDRQWR